VSDRQCDRLGLPLSPDCLETMSVLGPCAASLVGCDALGVALGSVETTLFAWSVDDANVAGG